jgi:hypothetical protein
VKRRLATAVALICVTGVGAAVAFQNETAPAPEAVAPQAAVAPSTTEPTPNEPAAASPAQSKPTPAPSRQRITPMKDRVAVLGLLNKRNGIWRDLKMHPGQAVRVGDVIVRLRACEKTAPWEEQKLTGAFVQTDVRGTDGKWRRVFSGWLYKESPSLNVVEHPIYDVWPKSCAMQYPDAGPDTVSAVSSGNSRSSAPKSGEGEPTPPETPSAESSNAT